MRFAPQVPFGQAPSLHRLRRCSRIIVRQLRRYHGPVRFPVSVHRRRASSDFPTRPVCNSLAGRHRTSRFPSKVFPDVHGVCDRAGSDGISRWRYHRCCLPLLLTASAPRSKVLSRLNTRPVRTPVNASAPLLRTAPHDSGQCGSLVLHCMTLSFTTPRRFNPAHKEWADETQTPETGRTQRPLHPCYNGGGARSDRGRARGTRTRIGIRLVRCRPEST